MAANFNVNEDGALLTDINTTPLIDVLLVLLIVLILAMPALTHRTMLENQPGPAVDSPAPRVEIVVEFDGSLYWNETAVGDFAQLESFLRSTAGESPQPQVVINANRNAKYDTVAIVLATAQRLGVRRIGFAGQERFSD